MLKQKNYNNSIRRSANNWKKIKNLGLIFSYIKFFITIAILAIFYSIGIYFSKYSIWCFLGICFVFLFLFMVSIQAALKKKELFWESLVKSYEASHARVTRNFLFLKDLKPLFKPPPLPVEHPYAGDLDVQGSLFLWLDSCSSSEGSQNLFYDLQECGQRLLSLSEIKKRHKIVSLLQTETKLVRVMESIRFSSQESHSYPKKTEIKKSQAILILFSICSIFIWLFLFLPALLNFIQRLDFQFLLRPVSCYVMILIISYFMTNPSIQNAQTLNYQLLSIRKVQRIFSFYTKRKFYFKKELSQYFTFLAESSFHRMKTLRIVIDMFSARGHPLAWVLLHAVLPLEPILFLFLTVVLTKISNDLPLWQSECIELDKLMCFSRIKIENPEFNCFIPPDIARSFEKTSISFANMGHPLLSLSKRVTHSLQLDKLSPMILLTGSNMSGKSTFLRSFATNTLLLNMGAPVCASSFTLPCSLIFCAISINDSILSSTSYFAAEVKKISMIIEELKKTRLPSVFFIDEIFKGTNNKERYLGALGVIKMLLNSEHYGILSTHDLALTLFAKEDPRLINMHFSDRVEEGKLIFDYKLNSGPSTSTNALFLMRDAGLVV